MTLDLFACRGGKIALAGTGALPPGHYARLRLHLRSAEIVRDHDGNPGTPGTVERLELPAGHVDVPVRMTIHGSEVVNLTLDFDAMTSVQIRERTLSPVVHVASLTRS